MEPKLIETTVLRFKHPLIWGPLRANTEVRRAGLDPPASWKTEAQSSESELHKVMWSVEAELGLWV